MYDIFVTLETFNEDKLTVKDEHPSNMLEQSVGNVGESVAVIDVRLAHPAKHPLLVLRFNGPQLLILNSFSLSPPLLNSHPLIVPFMVMVLIPADEYVCDLWLYEVIVDVVPSPQLTVKLYVPSILSGSEI